jgi:GT2 family glycosyltransferase
VRVGLVIVTHNSASEIGRCLQRVHGQTRLPDRIIVADSGSSDGTPGVIRDACAALGLAVELLPFDENVGFAVANNRAVERLGDCELVALLNPDAFPEPGWLSALVDASTTWSDAASFASRLMVAGTEDVVDGVGDVFHVSGLAWRVGYRQRLAQVANALTPHPVFAVCAAAALYRRDDWQRVGGFDERFFCYAEDVDLGFRLQLIGRGCRYVPDAVAYHVGSAVSGVDSAFSVYHGYRNFEWTFIKDMPSRLFWRYLPLHLFANVAQVVWFARKGRGGSVLRAKWDALRQLGPVLRDRRRVQATRVASVNDLRAALDRTPLATRFARVRARQQAEYDRQRRPSS